VYSVKIEGSFSSAHTLRQYKGKCEALHGHNWRVEAVARSLKLNKAGMVRDFHDLKGKLNSILEGLDHKYLNKIPYFKKSNPTSENIARFIYGKLKKKIPQIKSVTVWESPSSSATYEA